MSRKIIPAIPVLQCKGAGIEQLLQLVQFPILSIPWTTKTMGSFSDFFNVYVSLDYQRLFDIPILGCLRWTIPLQYLPSCTTNFMRALFFSFQFVPENHRLGGILSDVMPVQFIDDLAVRVLVVIQVR